MDIPEEEKGGEEDPDVEIPLETIKQSATRLNEWLSKYGFTFTQYDLEAVLEVSDTDHNGMLSKTEFTHAILSISEGVQATTIMELHQSVSKIQSKIMNVERLMMELHQSSTQPAGATASQDSFRSPPDSFRGNATKENVDESAEKLQRLADRIEWLVEDMEKDRAERSKDREEKAASVQKPANGSMSYERHLAGSNINIISLDTRLALKIDSCEAMVREIRRKVAELATDTREFVRLQTSPVAASAEMGRLLPEFGGQASLTRGLLDIPDPWSELEFEAPLEIPDVWEVAGQMPNSSPKAPQGPGGPQDQTRGTAELEMAFGKG